MTNNKLSIPHQFSGILPTLSIEADLGPPRTEMGIGCLLPWNGRLYVLGYLSHTKTTGSGSGLRYIDADMHLHHCIESVDGTYANRMIHPWSNQAIIGPHVIDANHNIRTIQGIDYVRIAATIEHMEDPENKVYLLGMEGEFLEVDLHTLKVTHLYNLVDELGVSSREVAHFKAGYMQFGRVVVANNTYEEADHLGKQAEGRLAEWDGNKWTVIENTAFVEVHGRRRFSGTTFATGWDKASVILKVFIEAEKKWKTYRLPKASHCFEHMWQTEWPRIREVEHERFLMDIHGMFYELSPWAYEGAIWGIKPISTHLWVLGDFCSWKGMLVLGSDNASPSGDENILAAEPMSGLWFGKTDDLWQFGKPSGWGGPWWHSDVEAGEASDPFLMTGFEHKSLHLANHGATTANLTIEIDFFGNGQYHTLKTVEVAGQGYVHETCLESVSAHWFRVRADVNGEYSAYVHYS